MVFVAIIKPHSKLPYKCHIKKSLKSRMAPDTDALFGEIQFNFKSSTFELVLEIHIRANRCNFDLYREKFCAGEVVREYCIKMYEPKKDRRDLYNRKIR